MNDALTPSYRRDQEQDSDLWRRLSDRYEWLVQRIVPCSEEFFEACVHQLPAGQASLLELGSGTGYATERILHGNPKIHATCLDFSPEMLASARAKSTLRTVRFVLGDIWNEWPEGRFDVVFSTLCLHHLTPSERRTVLWRAYARLKSNGLFINGDIFKPAELWKENFLRQRWVESMRASGLSKAEVEEMLAKRRSNMRCFDTPERHRANLAAAGFRSVECLWSCEMAGVWVASKS